MLQKKNRFKPVYKQFVNLRENILSNKKLLNFKKQKWEKLQHHYKRKLKRYKKFKPYDQTQHIVSKFSNKATSYKKRYKNTHIVHKKFKLIYGITSKKYLKKQILKINRKKNVYLKFLEHFEHRLDTILYRSKFSVSLRNSKQLIVHGKVLVNNKVTRIPSYQLKQGDLISIDPKFYFMIEKNLKNSNIWPIPPKYLSINYRTMEIVMNCKAGRANMSIFFPFHLNLEKIIVSYPKQQ